MEIMQDWLSEEMKRLQYNFIDNLGNYVNISPKFSNNTFRNGSNTIHLKVYKVMLFFRSASSNLSPDIPSSNSDESKQTR